MTTLNINENTIEQLALQWFQNLGYSYLPPSSTSPSAPNPLRTSSRQTLLLPYLEQALYSLNPSLPSSAIQDALSRLQQSTSPHLPTANQKAYNLLKNGVPVQYSLPNTPQPQGAYAKVIDFSNPSNNTWHITNQLSVQGPSRSRRPDLVVYINGVPIAIIELKNPIKETTDVWHAYQQLETYKNDIPDLFTFNQILLISDNNETRFGSITANRERYMKWRTIDGKTTDPLGDHASLETTIKGLFDPTLLLDYLQNFILFESNNSTTKKIAAYHQFHACRQAHKQIQLASQPNANHKGGVVWHTQGAGKSIEMVCLTGKLMTDPLMQNPTVLIVTDRNDLDGQLFATFSQATSILPEPPLQAKTRPQLRKLLLDRSSGGIIFTTIQKFSPGEDEDTFPSLSTRSNVVVIVDEAHRTQYGFNGEVSPTGTRYGYAKHLRDALPNATFTAFTKSAGSPGL